MKAIFINILLLGCISCAEAQQPDPILARVYYIFKHEQDTTKKDTFYTETMMLAIGKNASVYTSYNKIAQERNIEKQKKEQSKNFTGQGMPTFVYSNTRPVLGTEIYQFQRERKIFTKEFLIRNYLYETPLPEIAWKINPEIKIFGNISCQKATASFGGRVWNVWFAPEIPFQTGPWLLNGLPGLIIEAYDDKNEVSFQFSGLDDVIQNSTVQTIIKNHLPDNKNVLLLYDKATIITLPQNVVKTTKKEIEKLRAAMYKDPHGFFMAQLNATGGFVDDEGAMENFNFKNTINNPLEK